MYCDESSHLQNDGMQFMLIAYTSTPYNQLKVHNDQIKKIKAAHKFKGEIKWSNVSNSQFQFYSDLIDYFFNTELHYRAIIVDKSKIDENRKDFTYNDFYFRMYYQLLYHKLNSKYTYNIYLDIKDTISQSKLKILRKILAGNRTIRNIQFIRSHESYLMQLTDLITGAINYHLRKLDSVDAKINLIKKIEKHTEISLKSSTPRGSKKFNLFYIELQ